MIRYFTLLLFIGLTWGQDNPCEDPRYLELKNKSVDDMSDDDFDYFIDMLMISNNILNNESYNYLSDFNQDQNVNNLDIISMAQYILGF